MYDGGRYDASDIVCYKSSSKWDFPQNSTTPAAKLASPHNFRNDLADDEMNLLIFQSVTTQFSIQTVIFYSSVNSLSGHH